MDCGLVHRKVEGFFAKCIETDVDPAISHGCSECYGASRIEWVLTNPDVIVNVKEGICMDHNCFGFA